MTDHPADDIDAFMAELRAWTASTQRFARKVHALSQLQRSHAAELRIDAEEAVHRIQARRRTEQDVRDLLQALRRPPPAPAR